MKLKLATAGAIAGLMSAGSLLANDTNNLGVSATVNATCKFTSATSSLTIANSGAAIDPSLNTNATGSTTVQFRCTKGTSSKIAADNGAHYSGTSRQVEDGAGNQMAYGLVLTDADQVGTGHAAAAQTMTIDATITAATHQDSPAGSYTDTVVLSFTP